MTELIPGRLLSVFMSFIMIYFEIGLSNHTSPTFLTSGAPVIYFVTPSYKSSISVVSFADVYTPVWEQRRCLFSSNMKLLLGAPALTYAVKLRLILEELESFTTKPARCALTLFIVLQYC